VGGGFARSVRKLIPWPDSGRAAVVSQQSAQPLAATHVGAPERADLWCDQLVAEPLMVPLPMVVRHELVDGAEQPTFPEEDQAVETLRPDRAHEALRVGVGIGRLDGRQHDPYPHAFDDTAESVRPLAVTIAGPPPGYTDRGYPAPDVVMRSRDPVTMGQSSIRSAGLRAPPGPRFRTWA